MYCSKNAKTDKNGRDKLKFFLSFMYETDFVLESIVGDFYKKRILH